MSTLIHIERMAYGSDGIGTLDTGKTVFVGGTLPGDTVEADIHEEKQSYARATLTRIVEPSPNRVPLASPTDARAGTADWQHIAYDMQLHLKRENIVQSLARKGGFTTEDADALVAPVVPCRRQWNYRNKLELACAPDAHGRFTVGFHKEGTGEFVPATSCALAHKAIAAIPKALQGAIRFAQGTQDLGIHRVGVRHSLATGELEVALWTLPGAFPRGHFATTLASACKATGIVRVLAEAGGARKVKSVEVLEGRGRWRERMGKFTFATQAPSFFQVNTPQAERLVRLVVKGLSYLASAGRSDAPKETGTLEDALEDAPENAPEGTPESALAGTLAGASANTLEDVPTDALAGATIADLYAGGGTFSIPLAAAGADVIAVEAAASSIRDLRANADANGVFVDAIGGDAARELAALGNLDALVVDPPRAGLAANMIDAIAQARPQLLAYVSCDPATWLRDVERLGHAGYQLQRVSPVDLFPQTHHVELVALMLRVKK